MNMQTTKIHDEPTNFEILDAINAFATTVEQRFQGIENEISGIKAVMVTKDYLDDKMADMKGDLINIIRKQDTKVFTLTNILYQNKAITSPEFIAVQQLEPFPRK